MSECGIGSFWADASSGHYRHGICVFERGDVEYLLNIDQFKLFANKFDCNNADSQAAVAFIAESRNG